MEITLDTLTEDTKSDYGLRKGNIMDEVVSPSIWEDYVPIVSRGNAHHVYILDPVEGPNAYGHLVMFLQLLTSEDTVRLYINTPGGVVDTEFMLINSLSTCKAKVVGVLSGSVASAGTAIAMECDELEVGKHCQFMIHAASGGFQGKQNELKAYAAFSDKEMDVSMRDIYGGFLTDEELTQVIDGRDMWLNKSEVDSRWADRVKFKEGQTNA